MIEVFPSAWMAATMLAFSTPAHGSVVLSTPARTGPTHTSAARLHLFNDDFDLDTATGLAQLDQMLAEAIRLEEQQAQRRQRQRTDLLHGRRLADLTKPELKEYYSEPPGYPIKKQRRALKVMKAATQELLQTRLNCCVDEHWRRQSIQLLQELARAWQNAQRPPVPLRVDFVQTPWIFWGYWHHPVGVGVEPPTNLPAAAPLSDADPPNSTFWTRPEAVPNQDLLAGFGRPALPDWSNVICVYYAPKTGFGTAPGFEVECGKARLKVKFAETHSEPFAARIFSALGYHVEPTDYVPSLRIRYDRRLLREFDMRKEVTTTVTTFFIPSYKIRIQKTFDPFQFIQGAVLKNGQHLGVSELRQGMFFDIRRAHPEDSPANFNTAFEEQIDYLVTAPANVHWEHPRRQNVGYWDFDTLGHADLRELRGLALLAGWVGWFDCRFINTRLEVLETASGPKLNHVLPDLGSCLGKAHGLVSRQCEEPEEFAWTFTKPARRSGPGRMALPFRVIGYVPIQNPEAFKRMTVQDARWMARWIGQLSERQIREALVAAGFGPKEVRAYADKLINRRDQMIRDLDLTTEVSLLRPGTAAGQ